MALHTEDQMLQVHLPEHLLMVTLAEQVLITDRVREVREALLIADHLHQAEALIQDLVIVLTADQVQIRTIVHIQDLVQAALLAVAIQEEVHPLLQDLHQEDLQEDQDKILTI